MVQFFKTQLEEISIKKIQYSTVFSFISPGINTQIQG